MHQQAVRPRTRSRIRGPFPLLGPAFVAAIAYIDPGNFATNVTAGSRYGYLLLWVVVAGNLMAMLVQYLSAKAGIVTSRNLAELCRDHFPRPVTIGLWLQAELVAMATDLAEVLGGAIALNLLLGLPLPVGGVLTALVALAMLRLRNRGVRGFEVVVTGMLLMVMLGFAYILVLGGVDVGAATRGLSPGFAGTSSMLLAAGMIGATVMPHVIYLHGALTQDRYERGSVQEQRVLLTSVKTDVVLALGVAGLVNAAMLMVAASALSDVGHPVETLEAAHASLGSVLGGTAALAFALTLLASGSAASGVGTLSGQVVMQGFLRRRIPLGVRRGLTLAPALVVLSLHVDPTLALVLSQVVLSFGIPFALVPLVMLTSRASIMGPLVNRRSTRATAWLVAGAVCTMNCSLLALAALG